MIYPPFLTPSGESFFLLAGPCVIENEDMPFMIAEKLSKLCRDFSIPYVFKGSYKKANRSNIHSFTGIGDMKALSILGRIREEFGIPVVTDIHAVEEAAIAAPYVDVLQIPAFLCRQTDLLLAAAATGKCVNVKKGQFLSAHAMKFVVEKLRSVPGPNGKPCSIMLTERGSMFGYNDLIVDFRNIPIMQQNRVPVITDVTHSLQQPNQSSGVTGGNPEMIETIAKAAVAVGSDGLFIETHPCPSRALSDGANMLELSKMEALLEKLVRLRGNLS